MHPGSLDICNRKDPVPRTGRDAMYVVSTIGQQLLWVDRLCIIQDDPADKELQIGTMGATYNNAFFTIAATEGDHADRGLFFFGDGAASRTDNGEILSLIPDVRFLIGVQSANEPVYDNSVEHSGLDLSGASTSTSLSCIR